MTPSERALKLTQDIGMTTFKDGFNEGKTLPLYLAKRIALIAVEEIIPCTWKEETYYKKWEFTWVAPETTTEYWLSVIDEINKL